MVREPERGDLVTQHPAATPQLNGVTLDARTLPRRPPGFERPRPPARPAASSARSAGVTARARRAAPSSAAASASGPAAAADGRLPPQCLTQPGLPAIKIDLHLQHGPLALQLGVGLLRRHRRFGLPDGDIGLQRLDPGDVRAARARTPAPPPARYAPQRRRPPARVRQGTAKGAHLFAQPGLHGRETRRAEQLLQQLSALFGVAGEEAGEVTLRQQDDLEELARAHPQQALKVADRLLPREWNAQSTGRPCTRAAPPSPGRGSCPCRASSDALARVVG